MPAGPCPRHESRFRRIFTVVPAEAEAQVVPGQSRPPESGPVRAWPGCAPGSAGWRAGASPSAAASGREEAGPGDEWGFVRRQPRLPRPGLARTTEAVCERNGNEPPALPKEPHPLPLAVWRNAGKPERNPRRGRRSRSSETPLRRAL